MAIYHMSMKPLSRTSGRSAVAASAYRSGEELINEKDGVVHNYTFKEGIEHTEIVLPEGIEADWAKDRSRLWNAAEFAEKRMDARVAREFEIALPHELTQEQRLEAARAMAQDLANRYGAAVDFAIHAPHEQGDIRNYHAHLLMTTRQITPEGLGEKTHIERENKWLLSNNLPTTTMQLRDIRMSWEGIANRQLALADLDIRIDHRSHMARGLEIEPTEHMGVHATQMERRGLDVSRSRLDADKAELNAELIRENPDQVLDIITGEKSVFDRQDVARALHRYLDGDPEEFQNAFARVMASDALVMLQPERTDPKTKETELARFSTKEFINIEYDMVERVKQMDADHSHIVDPKLVREALAHQDQAIQRATGDLLSGLSNEQRSAIRHVTGPERVSLVVGFAGAGKSTMLAAAREAWEGQGYTVHGAALSGKAAEGLEESSGIASRTLASWALSWERGSWKNDRNQLGKGDVFVIDEAGMIGSRQLAGFVAEAEKRGAKIVLVGDHEQLQAIGAGAPFRAIAERIGMAELSEVRRQRVDWQSEASIAFATQNTVEGLEAYRDAGNIRFSKTNEEALRAVVSDYIADVIAHRDQSRIAMAHKRADVHAINEGVREQLKTLGHLPSGEEDGARTYQTNNGKREFAPGDRVVFLENNRDLGVKNGMLATVEQVEPGRITATLDGEDGESVTVAINEYQAIDHGYATTIHKNQGATVDRAFVLASKSMDRHLTYVAMTRHRDDVRLYADRQEFSNRLIGKLVAHGEAPYEHKQGYANSYFVTLESDQGEKHTVWSKDFKRAIEASKFETGDEIGLLHKGTTVIAVKNGKEITRNNWEVVEPAQASYSILEGALSRSGKKETTLDYELEFARQRGFAGELGIDSEISVYRSQTADTAQTDGLEKQPERQERADRSRAHDLPPAHYGAIEGRVRPEEDRSETINHVAGLEQGAAEKANENNLEGRAEHSSEVEAPQIMQAKKQRRSMFDGLKLNATTKQEQQPETRDTEQDRLVERLRQQTLTHSLTRNPFETAIDRYAQAFNALGKQLDQGLPMLEGQKRELQEAYRQLDQIRPGSRELIRSAMQHDPQTARAVMELSGRERIDQLVAGMERERVAVSDPNVRADRFVERWQELQNERRQLRGGEHDDARGKVEADMRKLVKTLERDPDMEEALQARAKDLGFEPVRQEMRSSKDLAKSPAKKLTGEMERQITRQQTRGRGPRR